jgi:NAD(P)-dependent dehydrogenase (short-subunit alcohol dehydrogenase family)
MHTFNAGSTTTDVIQHINLKGKTVLVTGASAGLGLETSRCLANAGARIIMAARNAEKLAAAQQQILTTVPSAQLQSLILDLSDVNSIRQAAQQLLDKAEPIDVLINNAGVMACPFEKTAQGFEMQFGTNHLGHFLFTNLILPLLIKAPNARIVCLSSAAHKFAAVNVEDPNYLKRPYNKWQAYGEAKSANALFALALNKRLRKYGIDVFSVHPGMIATELGRHLDADDLKMLMGGNKERSEKPKDAADITKKENTPKKSPFKTIPQGAATSVWAATAFELKGKGGIYLEDCQIAEPSQKASSGYAPHIADEQLAEKLWQVSEQILEQSFSY